MGKLALSKYENEDKKSPFSINHSQKDRMYIKGWRLSFFLDLELERYFQEENSQDLLGPFKEMPLWTIMTSELIQSYVFR